MICTTIDSCRRRFGAVVSRSARRVPPVAVLGALILALTAGAACAAPSGGTLFVQQAKGGSLIKRGGGWQLVLREPASRTTTFSDRPARVGGSLSLAKLVSSWHADFGTDAPNAALEITDAPQARDVALLELSSPHYDASRGLLTFRARPLRTNSDPALATLAHRADRGVHGGFGRASLSIDNGAEGNVVTFEFTGIPQGAAIELSLTGKGERYHFDPAASFLSSTPGIQWTGEPSILFMNCSFPGCSGTATLSVEAPPSVPLVGHAVLPETGTVTATWAAGPVTILPVGGGPFSLEGAKP
jgi:hypothetical protein